MDLHWIAMRTYEQNWWNDKSIVTAPQKTKPYVEYMNNTTRSNDEDETCMRFKTRRFQISILKWFRRSKNLTKFYVVIMI